MNQIERLKALRDEAQARITEAKRALDEGSDGQMVASLDELILELENREPFVAPVSEPSTVAPIPIPQIEEPVAIEEPAPVPFAAPTPAPVEVVEEILPAAEESLPEIPAEAPVVEEVIQEPLYTEEPVEEIAAPQEVISYVEPLDHTEEIPPAEPIDTVSEEESFIPTTPEPQAEEVVVVEEVFEEPLSEDVEIVEPIAIDPLEVDPNETVEVVEVVEITEVAAVEEPEIAPLSEASAEIPIPELPIESESISIQEITSPVSIPQPREGEAPISVVLPEPTGEIPNVVDSVLPPLPEAD